MTELDIVVFAIYVIGVTAFGCLFYKRSSDSEGFTYAHGRLSGWVVGLSIFGTYLSSISFLALPGKSYIENWNAYAFSLSLPFAAIVAVKWFAPLYRASRDVSAYAYLERRFGVWARLYAMTFYLLTQFTRVGTILFLIALALERLAGWDITNIILLTGVLVTIYTVVGGIEAVIWTDAIQAAVLTVGAIVCAIILLNGMPEGPSQLFSIAMEKSKFSLGSFAIDFTESTFWVVLIFGLFINLQNFGIDQSYVQRYHTAKSLEDARKSIWVGTMLYIPVSGMFLFIGSALFAYYTAQPDLLLTELRADGMGDRIFPYFIVETLPPGFTGLIIAALFAAAMSSIDSSLNSSSTILMTDVYTRFVNKDASDAQKTRFLRISTLVLGCAGTAVAIKMISIKSVLGVWWNLSGIFSGGMLGLFLLGALSRRASSPQAAVGVVAGLALIVYASFAKNFEMPYPLHSLMTTVIGTLTIFLIGSVLSKGRKRIKRSDPPKTIFEL